MTSMLRLVFKLKALEHRGASQDLSFLARKDFLAVHWFQQKVTKESHIQKHFWNVMKNSHLVELTEKTVFLYIEL